MDWSCTYAGVDPVRVNKWLAQQGVCSRREAEELILSGQVAINGQPVRDVGRKIAPGETLTLAPRAVAVMAQAATYVVHKPVGFVSAQPAPGQIPAARLLTAAAQVGPGAPPVTGVRLAPLGRLDQDSRGLLLLSQDGVLAKAVIGPDSSLTKDYCVRVEGQVTRRKLALLRHGLTLDGRALKRAVVEQQEQSLRFVLTEGRNRQIRRMCELVGLHVVDLLRTRIGCIALGDLPEGAWRLLTGAERAGLIAAAQPKSGGPRHHA
jgi:23S rRNA pseudouridine2604 synthase